MVHTPEQSRDRSETAGSMPPEGVGHGHRGHERDRSAAGTATPTAGPSNVKQGKKEEEEDYASADEVHDIDALLKVDLNEPLEAGIMKSPPVKLTILKGLNYHIWA